MPSFFCIYRSLDVKFQTYGKIPQVSPKTEETQRERGRERERELLELSGSPCITEAICCSPLVKRAEMLQLVQMASEQKFGARAALCLVDVHILASRQVPAQPVSSMAYRAPVTSYQAASGWFSCLCNKTIFGHCFCGRKKCGAILGLLRPGRSWRRTCVGDYHYGPTQSTHCYIDIDISRPLN